MSDKTFFIKIGADYQTKNKYQKAIREFVTRYNHIVTNKPAEIEKEIKDFKAEIKPQHKRCKEIDVRMVVHSFGENYSASIRIGEFLSLRVEPIQEYKYYNLQGVNEPTLHSNFGRVSVFDIFSKLNESLKQEEKFPESTFPEEIREIQLRIRKIED